MNRQEFRELKEGDKISSGMGDGVAVVTNVSEQRGARLISVQWGGIDAGRLTAPTFTYTELHNNWMHWSKVKSDDVTTDDVAGFERDMGAP